MQAIEFEASLGKLKPLLGKLKSSGESNSTF